MRLAIPVRPSMPLLLLLALLALPLCARAGGVKWIEPTPTELAMTSEPKAPGAPAIVLSYSEKDDPYTGEVEIHGRVKILTEAGLSAGTVNLPKRAVQVDPYDEEYSGRTIHPDGSVELFRGKPQDGTAADGFYGSHKVMVLPAVTVGSIVEYAYHYLALFRQRPGVFPFYAHTWRVQQQYFIRSASFALQTEIYGENPYEARYVRWLANLPPVAKVVQGKGCLLLNLEDIPAGPAEEFMPPSLDALWNVRFYYDLYGSSGDPSQFWGFEGGTVSLPPENVSLSELL